MKAFCKDERYAMVLLKELRRILPRRQSNITWKESSLERSQHVQAWIREREQRTSPDNQYNTKNHVNKEHIMFFHLHISIQYWHTEGVLPSTTFHFTLFANKVPEKYSNKVKRIAQWAYLYRFPKRHYSYFFCKKSHSLKLD